MLRKVPTAISCFLGTIAVSTIDPSRLTNLMWLPFWEASANPAASSLRLTSRKGCGLSRPNFDLDQADLWWPRSLRRLKVEIERFAEIIECFLFRLALAGNVQFKALSDVPILFLPNGRSEWALHASILAQVSP